MALSKKFIIISVAILVVGVSAVFAYKYFDGRSNDDGASADNVTEDMQAGSDERAKSDTSQDQDNSEPSSTDQVKLQKNPTITTADGSSDPAQVRAFVDGVKNGTCILTITKSGYSDIVMNAPVGLVTNYYACQGFNIPYSKFPAGGEWFVKVQFESDTATGVSETKNLVINK